jgi:hypothetical protein
MRTTCRWPALSPALLSVAALACAMPASQPPRASATDEARAAVVQEASALLDTLHEAASNGDGVAYFQLFAEDAIYLGTDAGERWTLPEFRAYAEPYFAQGRGWTYTSTERHLTASDGADVVWFDERLQNDKYGEVRGSGVIRATPAGLKIAHYVLSFPVPNELAEDLAVRVRGLHH